MAPVPGETYVTQPGDSWWSLAERAYGDGRLYRAIFAWMFADRRHPFKCDVHAAIVNRSPGSSSAGRCKTWSTKRFTSFAMSDSVPVGSLTLAMSIGSMSFDTPIV